MNPQTNNYLMMKMRQHIAAADKRVKELEALVEELKANGGKTKVKKAFADEPVATPKKVVVKKAEFEDEKEN